MSADKLIYSLSNKRRLLSGDWGWGFHGGGVFQQVQQRAFVVAQRAEPSHALYSTGSEIPSILLEFPLC